VWEQQIHWFENLGDFCTLSVIFIEQLTSMIEHWRQTGADVMFAIDANQHVYTSPLSRTLLAAPLSMNCQLSDVTGSAVANSHFHGTTPISTIFGSPELKVGNRMCFPHWFGVGDHCVFIVEVSASTLFGDVYPSIALPTLCALNCWVSHIKKRYCSELTSLVTCHNMLTKLQLIAEISSPDQYVVAHNK
jgi:hypothetical protein